MRAYLWTVCGLSALAVGGAVLTNYVVDPYLMHQWDSPRLQVLGPAREKLSAWGKTYAVARARPQVLYLGNSRTELGLPVQVPAFGQAAVFNAALSGASLGDAAAMARHALAFGSPRAVVWGIDAPSFTLAAGTLDFDRALVAGGPHYFGWRALLDARRALALDITGDTLRVLRGSFGAVCRSNLALRGQRDTACVAAQMRNGGGTRAAVLPRLREFIGSAGPSEEALAPFGETLAEFCRRGSVVRVHINPTHAVLHAALFQAGRWEALERWQRGVTGAVERVRAHGCDVRLYDFSGFNSVTTEALPQASGRAEMRYYWEPSHYREEVGRMMLAAMFGGAPLPPADFGIELRPPMLARFQALQRAARDEYRRTHPVEAALARAAADELARPR